MEIYWTRKAQNDLARIYRFALQYSHQHATEVVDRLITSSADLTEHPAMGIQQTRYLPREVRKVLFDNYEIHYEIAGNDIFVLDLWSTREDR